MKKLLFLLIALCVTPNLISQGLRDLIITEFGDSIKCTISGMKNKSIYFLYKSESGVKTLSFPLDRVKSYKYGFYKIQKSEIKIEENAERSPEERRILLSLGGGYGFHIAKLDDGISHNRDYYEKLKSGFILHANVSYLIDEQLGFGFKLHRFLTSNELQSAKLSDNLRITLIGPCFSFRTKYSQRSNLYTNSYIGFLKYQNNATHTEPLEISGQTFGLGSDVGLEVKLSTNFYLNFQASLNSAFLKQYIIKTGLITQTLNLPKDKYENLSRLDFSIGIKFK